MQDKQVAEVLRKLHKNSGFPRLEVEGVGELSSEARILNWFHHDGAGESAVYVTSDDYTDMSYVTEFQIDFLRIPKERLEELVEAAMQSKGKEAAMRTSGTRVRHYEKFDNYSGKHIVSPRESREVMVDLSLNLEGEMPVLSVEYPIWQNL